MGATVEIKRSIPTYFNGMTLIKPYNSAVAAFALLQASVSAAAAPPQKLSFDYLLSSSIVIEGDEDRRFPNSDRMAHYRVPGVFCEKVSHRR